MAAGPDAYGQKWYLEAAARANVSYPAASVYVSDFEVFAFHRYTPDGFLVTFNYDVSIDGGQTFPTMRATAFSGGNDVFGARTFLLANGTRRFLLLLNDASALAYSDTVLTLPTASTWTLQALPNGGGPAVGAPIGFEVSGLTILIAGQQGAGGDLRIWISTDGGATLSNPVADFGVDTVVTPSGLQVLCAPLPTVWCLLNPRNGRIYRTTDTGASWGGGVPVKTIVAGNVALAGAGAIFAVNATRLVAVWKGQVVTSDDTGATWTDRQNLTLNPPSTTAINQGAIGHLASFGSAFGVNAGVEVLGGVTAYPHEFTGATTRGAMWRSLDLGTTWTLVDCVGGSNLGGSSYIITGFAARAGRAVMDMREYGFGPFRHSWFNPNPPTPPATMGPQLLTACSSFTVCPCPSTSD